MVPLNEILKNHSVCAKQGGFAAFVSCAATPPNIGAEFGLRFQFSTYLRKTREVEDIDAIAMDIIVATAMTMGAPLLSSDKRILKYAHVKTIWK